MDSGVHFLPEGEYTEHFSYVINQDLSHTPGEN